MKRIFTLVLAVAIIAMSQVFAVPAYPNPINYTLPDGSQITIQLRGSEWVNWAETLDGFTLLRNSDGFFEYAVLNEHGDLTLSGIRVNDARRRIGSEQDFLPTLERGLMFSHYQIETKLEFRRIRNEVLQRNIQEHPRRTSGSVRIPVILVGFADRPFTRSAQDFYLLFNELNHTLYGAVGSVRDYFLDVSNGKFDLQADIFGPFNLPNPISFYDDECFTDGRWGDPRIMAMQAIDSAAANGANFANYAVNGIVPAVHIIFAGYCQAAGATACHSIWSHAWGFGEEPSPPVPVHNGVEIPIYSVSPEFRGNPNNNPTGVIGGIGVVVHEIGHALLGWPDSYSIVGVIPTNCVDLDMWCVMAAGPWGGPAGAQTTVPTRPSAWFLVDAGWVDEITLSTPQDVTLPNPATSTHRVYRINTTTPGEYFLLENRQRVGWDAFIPANGMIIYHVDRTPEAMADWNGNAVTGHCNRRRLYIKQAGCAVANGCIARPGNPWPRSNDVWPRGSFTEFSDYSVPNARSWAGNPTNKFVTNITHNTSARTISFKFALSIYNVALDQIDPHIFDTVFFGYDAGELAPLEVIITNIGNQSTGTLNITLGGDSVNSFKLSKTSIENIAVGEDSAFTVVPNTGLVIGTHEAVVLVTGDNDISQSFNVSFTVKQATSISVFEQNATFSISPNPVTDQLQITSDNLQIGDVVELFDMNGRRVFSKQINCHSSLVSCNFIIDISHLPSGVYIVRIGQNSARIIKQ